MEAEIKFTHQTYSQGFTISISSEEERWLERINRYPLWFRYAPPHIQNNPLALVTHWAAKSREEDWKRFYGISDCQRGVSE